MRAEKYKVNISIDPVHKWGDEIIQEIFIPDLELIINEKGYVFPSKERRGDIDLHDINLDDNLVEFIENYNTLNVELLKLISQLFKG